MFLKINLKKISCKCYKRTTIIKLSRFPILHLSLKIRPASILLASITMKAPIFLLLKTIIVVLSCHRSQTLKTSLNTPYSTLSLPVAFLSKLPGASSYLQINKPCSSDGTDNSMRGECSRFSEFESYTNQT